MVGAIARGVMEKSGCVKVIKGEEVRGDDPVEYLLPVGGWRYLLSFKGGDGS